MCPQVLEQSVQTEDMAGEVVFKTLCRKVGLSLHQCGPLLGSQRLL